MNEREWKPKVGDKVKVLGHGADCSGRLVMFTGEVRPVREVTPDGYVGVHDPAMGRVFLHSRLCDPVLEEERKGAPRPKPVDGEDVVAVLTVPFQWGRFSSLTIRYQDAEIRQIERRRENLGREARKS